MYKKICWLLLVILVLVTVSVASAQEPEATPEPGDGQPVIQVTESGDWTPRDYTLLAIGLIVPIATIISVVAVVFIQNGSIKNAVAALSASVDKLNTIETAVNTFPPQAVDIINTFGKALTFVPQLKEVGDLLQKVSDHQPNEPVTPETVKQVSQDAVLQVFKASNNPDSA